MPTRSANLVEPIDTKEARGLKEASGGKSFELAMVVSIEPDIVIVSEIVAKPSAPLHKNLVDVARPSTPPKDFVDVARPSTPPP